jgi:hypothetical protein
VADLRAPRWQQLIVVDDGSHTPLAANAGAQVIRHPYNKGNGAAVKTGSARRRRVRADHRRRRSHRPSDAVVAALDRYDLRSAPGPRRRRSESAVVSQHILNALAGYLADRPISINLGVPGRTPLALSSPPAPQWFLDANDDDAGVHQGGIV